MQRNWSGVSWRVWGGFALTVALCLGVVVPVSAKLTTIKLSGPMAPSGSIYSYVMSPDSRYAVYRADQDVHNVWELYSVPIAGGAPVNAAAAQSQLDSLRKKQKALAERVVSLARKHAFSRVRVGLEATNLGALPRALPPGRGPRWRRSPKTPPSAGR